jgi:hypothetical protein
MTRPDPNAPGVLTVNVNCGNCRTNFPLSKYIGGPPPPPGRYKLAGDCPKCGTAASVEAQVANIGQG